MSELYNKVEKFVFDSFTKAGKSEQNKHFERTVYWVKQLKPGADEALLIAAVAHDIERAYRKEDIIKLKEISDFTNSDFLRPHEERGAGIISHFLEENNADSYLVDKVKMLVLRHEEGGNDDQNLLKDADSVSFFENNLPIFYKKAAEIGKEKVKKKINWMYNRITSNKAKEIVKDWYKEGLKKLEKT